LKEVASTGPKKTSVAPPKLVPVMLTVVPPVVVPVETSRLVTVGAGAAR